MAVDPAAIVLVEPAAIKAAEPAAIVPEPEIPDTAGLRLQIRIGSFAFCQVLFHHLQPDGGTNDGDLQQRQKDQQAFAVCQIPGDHRKEAGDLSE